MMAFLENLFVVAIGLAVLAVMLFGLAAPQLSLAERIQVFLLGAIGLLLTSIWGVLYRILVMQRGHDPVVHPPRRFYGDSSVELPSPAQEDALRELAAKRRRPYG